MSERKMIYLCLAHMSEEGPEQKYVKDEDVRYIVESIKKAIVTE